MIDPNSPVVAAALDAWFANANLPNAHRMAAALEAAIAEFRRRNSIFGLALPPEGPSRLMAGNSYQSVVGASQISAIGGSDDGSGPEMPIAVYDATEDAE